MPNPQKTLLTAVEQKRRVVVWRNVGGGLDWN